MRSCMETEQTVRMALFTKKVRKLSAKQDTCIAVFNMVYDIVPGLMNDQKVD